MSKMKCDKFCNYHCSYDCPNFAVDAFEDKYDLPASEIGLERIKCKDCQYFDKNCTCDDCYFQYSKDCPENEKDGEPNER
ncbi:MAG: hypothetical protein MJ062_05600 [Oscillospiraceae bacterium]|nr:hypothetical protein [Oscillospiraceae bacterium]